MRIATIKDVAREADVSPATVSRVMNHISEVTPDLRIKVEAAIKHLGYKPNHAARVLVNRKTNSIGVIVNNLHDPFFTDLIRGFEAGAQQTSYNVIFGSVMSADIKRKEQYIDYMIHGVVDGIVLFGSYIEDETLFQYINSGTVCFAIIENDMMEAVCNKLLIKNTDGVKKGMEYLIRKGHKKIAFLCGNLNRRVMSERLNGYLDGMRKGGLVIHSEYVQYVNITEYESVQQRMQTLLHLPDRIDAIFCADDAIASYAIRVIQDYGLRVPENISVMGFDNRSVLPGGYQGPEITTVSQPLYQIGYDSIEILAAQLNAPETEPVCRTYNTEIVEKESVGERIALCRV